MVIQACTSPFFITLIHSHTGLPGPLAKGNQTVDQLISFNVVQNSENPSSIFQQALQSQSLLQQSANMLHKQFPNLTQNQCKHIIRACPTCNTLLPLGPNTGINPHGLKANHIWQTDVIHIPQFGMLKYVHVTVDTYSGVLFASAHTGETTKHAFGHLLGGFATFGIPKSINMDNDLTYTSKKFQEFYKLRDITHNTGIPYNPQGQAIGEHQHQKIKNQLFKIKKVEFTCKSPHTQLHLILLTLNFFSLDEQGITPMERHFHA
jgi:transposase InsO family protein